MRGGCLSTNLEHVDVCAAQPADRAGGNHDGHLAPGVTDQPSALRFHQCHTALTEDPMTTRTRPRPASVTAYYLGRPAAFWLTALAPRRPAASR